jgi:hypothetical protein
MISLIAFLLLLLVSENLSAQSNDNSGASITQLQLETMSIFSSPAVLVRAERSRIRQDGWSYGFAVGGLLAGATNKQERSADRLDLMLYAGLVFGLHTYVNERTVFYSEATISLSFLDYYWRRDQMATNTNFATLLQPELGFRLDLSEKYQISVGTSLLYGDFMYNSVLFPDRARNFWGFPSLSISLSTIR